MIYDLDRIMICTHLLSFWDIKHGIRTTDTAPLFALQTAVCRPDAKVIMCPAIAWVVACVPKVPGSNPGGGLV